MELLRLLLRAKPYLLIADGGDATRYVTCSYSAVKAALDQPQCAGIALPVRLTADGVPVVFPESGLGRMTGLDLKLSDLSWGDVSLLSFQHRIEIRPGVFFQYQQSESPLRLADILPEIAGLDFAVFLYFPQATTWEAVRAAQKASALIKKCGMENQTCIVPSLGEGLLWQTVGAEDLAKGVWCSSRFQFMCYQTFRLGNILFSGQRRVQAALVPLEAHRVWAKSFRQVTWMGYHTQHLMHDQVFTYLDELLEESRPFLLLNGRVSELCETLHVNK